MIRTRQFGAKSLLALSVLLVTAAAILLLAWDQGSAGTAEAQEPEYGMTLGGPATANLGETFQITVNADPAPDYGVAGFQTEVMFGGLNWLPRAVCADEVPVTHSGGSAVPVCVSAEGPVLQARHAVAAGAVPPLPALDTPLTTLVELDVECPAEGVYTVLLTAETAGVPSVTAYAAAYFDLGYIPNFVEATGTVDRDHDGDTVPETIGVVDILEVTCGEAQPTPIPTEPGPDDDTAGDVLSPPPDLSPVFAADTGTGSAGGDGAGLWAAISALMAAAAASFAILGWRYARNRS